MEDMNHRVLESRSAYKANDCNKEITSQTLLAAPVTECLLYFVSLFDSKNSPEKILEA